MSGPSHDPSVFDEPHWQARPLDGGSNPSRNERDPHGAAAEPHLKSAPLPPQGEEAAFHSIFDELNILPQAPELIEQDWTCSSCGYNLRGLMVGHPCPECGQVELYRPPPPGAGGYHRWLIERRRAVTPLRSRLAIGLVAAVGGVTGILGTFLTPHQLGGGLHFGFVLMAVSIGPTIEEVMKLAAAAVLVERRPYLIRRPGDLRLIAVAAGLGFAVIENLFYLVVLIPNPTRVLLLWRWLACTTMHVACCLVAVRGLIRVWERTAGEGRQPRMDLAAPALTQAIILHAAFNLLAMLLSASGWF